MTESYLTNKMRLHVKARGGWARKSHGGPAGAGWLDLVCVYRGYPVHLEVKLPGRENTLTKLQKATIADLRAAGAIARMVTTVEQVDAILDHIDRVRGPKVKKGT